MTRTATTYYDGYELIGLVVILGVLLVTAALTTSRLLRPTAPTQEKLLTYECGVDPVGPDWSQTQIRYYVYSFLYVVFAVDAVYLFPWATVFAAPGFGTTTLVEMFLFLAFIAIGLLYAWQRGVLEWT